MKLIGKIAVCAVALALACGVNPLFATDEIAKQQGKLKCTACHDKAGSKLLTDQGKYYESMGSLDGYTELNETFGRCTACHVNKPGSDKLTKKGKQLSEVVSDMAELRVWLDQKHPVLSETPEKSKTDKN